MSGERVLIVGGGIGGMSAAIALSQAGAEAELVDLDPNWGVAGAGITITGPTLRALDQLGCYDEVAAAGYVGHGIRLCNVAGEPQRDLETPLPVGSRVASSGGVMRPVLHGIMRRAMDDLGVPVRLGLSVDGFAQDADGVSVSLSDGSVERYDMVVGADGINSRTRMQIFPDAPAPAYTGQSTWRISCARPPEVDRRHFFLGGPNKVGFTPVSSTEMYLFINQGTPRPEIRTQELLRQQMRGLLADYGGYVAAIRDSIDDSTTVVLRPLEAFVLPAPWHVGRVVLIGDAAHPTTPQLASGAGIAVEDALVLAEELEGAEGVDAALAAYTVRREPRCRLVVESSVAIGRLEQEHAPPAEQTAIVDRALALLAEPI